MKNLKELRARLVQLQKDAQAIVDKTEMADDDQTRFDSIMAEIAQTKVAVSNREQVEALGAELQESAGRRTDYMEIGDEARVSGGEDRQRQDPWAGFSGAYEFTRAVRVASNPNGGAVDPRLTAIPKLLGAPTGFHRETGSDEGYMVPTALRDGVWEAVEEINEEIFNDVDTEPTGGNSVQFVKDETTPWGSTGVKAYFVGEGQQGTRSRLGTSASLMPLHKMMVLVEATDELLEDAPRLFNRLTKKSGEAINWKGSWAINEGTGAGMPLGYMNSAAVVSVAKETGQAADSVVADNVAKMYARCINPSKANWYLNQDVLPQLFTLKIGDQPIWTPPSEGFKQAPGGFLLGRPVKISEHCQTLGDAGDIRFVNPMGYYSPRKNSGLKFAQSLHLWFDYEVEAFRWTFRMGGAPYLSAPISPNKGSTTRSHFVTLAVRT